MSAPNVQPIVRAATDLAFYHYRRGSKNNILSYVSGVTSQNT